MALNEYTPNSCSLVRYNRETNVVIKQCILYCNCIVINNTTTRREATQCSVPPSQCSVRVQRSAVTVQRPTVTLQRPAVTVQCPAVDFVKCPHTCVCSINIILLVCWSFLNVIKISEVSLELAIYYNYYY